LLMLTCVVFVEFMALCDAAPRAVQEEGVVRRKGRRSEKSERERERQAEDEACLRATRAHGGGTGSPLWPLPTTCTRDRPRGARAPRKLAC
ncbi:unnamed protein product, partial [Prorocentrum cordatum]